MILQVPVHIETPRQVKRPLAVSLIVALCFLRAGIFLLLTLLMYLASVSPSVSHQLALHVWTLNMLPWLLSPPLVAIYGMEGAYREVLPIAFFVIGALSAVGGWFLYRLQNWMRWVVLLVTSSTALGTVISVLADGAAWNAFPLHGDHLLALFTSISLKLLVFCLLAFNKGVRRAFGK